jgi:hypothetical protein
MSRLPAQFMDLERFLEYWDVATCEERMRRRSLATMPDIQEFYGAMTSRGEEILQHLDGFALNQLPDAQARLFRLLLSLAQAAMAVEIHGQPRVPYSPFPHAITLLRPPQPYGG